MLAAGSTGLAEREFQIFSDLGTKGRVLINRFGRRPLAMSAIPRFTDSTRTSPEVREGPIASLRTAKKNVASVRRWTLPTGRAQTSPEELGVHCLLYTNSEHTL
jgi:hypothetical protein